MTGTRVTWEEKQRYISYRQAGATITEAARRVGRSQAWAHKYEAGKIDPDVKATFPTTKAALPVSAAVVAGRPIPFDELCDEAKRALEDFEFFRRRYFGHVSQPWHVEAATVMRELLESDLDEYVVVNTPPGAGKTTLFTCDIPAWLICRNRAMRVLLGHDVQTMANTYSGRLRSMFTRKTPVQASERDIRLGLAVDAEATLVGDFGPFKPAVGEELWRRDAFTVVQDAEVRQDEKESTVVAFGQNSGQLGYRADYIVWDDLDSTQKSKTSESVEDRRRWFDDVAESRLEPGGVFVLVGQRLGANDIYRYCLDKRLFTEEDLDDYDAEASGDRMYRHIVFRAHDETRCKGEHGRDAPPWPDGCLLDPKRLSWSKLRRVMADERKFRVLYQQEDVDPAAVLVPKVWVNGGTSESGEVFPGCKDKDRRLCQLPDGLRPPLISVASVDPSPSKYWAVEWFVVQPSTGLRFLMDLERRSMTAPDFLDWSQSTQTHSGLMESWQRRSMGMGVPIQFWIIEQNAAQRWLLQFEHFQTWRQRHRVRVIAHDTHGQNKADPEFGLEGRLRPIFRDGLLRLPWHDDLTTRSTVQKLIDEATRYPDSSTDDTLMALWFMEHNMRAMVAPDPGSQPRKQVPSFLAA